MRTLVTKATGFRSIPICQALFDGSDKVAGTRRNTSDISCMTLGVLLSLFECMKREVTSEGFASPKTAGTSCPVQSHEGESLR